MPGPLHSFLKLIDQPSQAKPNQTKPSQAKPNQAKPSEKPSQAKALFFLIRSAFSIRKAAGCIRQSSGFDLEVSEVLFEKLQGCHGFHLEEQAKTSQSKPKQAQPSSAKPNQTKPSRQAKPSQTKPSQTKPSQTKPSQAKPSHFF